MRGDLVAASLALGASGCQLVVGSYATGKDASADAPVDRAVVDALTLDAERDGADAARDAGTDARADATPDGGCVEGAQRCGDGGIETCGAGGAYGAPWACATASCMAGACTGSTSGTSNPSCTAGGIGLDNCGASDDSCCTSQEVPGGTYARTYVNTGAGAKGLADPASISGFRLDEYLVTVGRFGQFVNALDTGYTPSPGSGIHAHLNGGLGLRNAAEAGTYELGWLAADQAHVAPTTANLTACTVGGVSYSTWSLRSSGGESAALPMNCVNWYEAYAFCIWDGGFLPSEAEWEYAAAGGSQQRQYPWGTTAPGTASAYAIFGCLYPSGSGKCSSITAIPPVGTASMGVAAWGQLDLAGELLEWTLDVMAPKYLDPCVDCANLSSTGSSQQVTRGGAFSYDTASLLPPARNSSAPASRNVGVGFRCARTP